MDLAAPILGLGTAAASNFGTILPVLLTFLVYLNYEVADPESKIIETDVDELLPSYDFVIVGGGSAGKYTHNDIQLIDVFYH